MKKQIKTSGEHYYTYVLCYVDDLLIVHKEPYKDMEKIKEHYPVAEKSIGPLSVYFSANIKKLRFNTTNLKC